MWGWVLGFVAVLVAFGTWVERRDRRAGSRSKSTDAIDGHVRWDAEPDRIATSDPRIWTKRR